MGSAAFDNWETNLALCDYHVTVLQDGLQSGHDLSALLASTADFFEAHAGAISRVMRPYLVACIDRVHFDAYKLEFSRHVLRIAAGQKFLRAATPGLESGLKPLAERCSVALDRVFSACGFYVLTLEDMVRHQERFVAGLLSKLGVGGAIL